LLVESTNKARRISVALLFLALLWGFGEATVFFVVPDVVISLIALLYGWRAGGLAVVAAILGAMIGGIVVYYWGQADLAGANAFFDSLPAISAHTIARAKRDILGDQFGVAMLMGSVTSVPFKLYAAQAGASAMPLWTLVAITPLVRLPRFALAVVVVGIAHKFAPAMLHAHKIKLLALFWISFYAFYWSVTPS
jgi:membrane protein YqaA with SNARE-associated domain